MSWSFSDQMQIAILTVVSLTLVLLFVLYRKATRFVRYSEPYSTPPEELRLGGWILKPNNPEIET